jgi:hypothetical protein
MEQIANEKVMHLINSQKLRDGQITPDVYIAMECRNDELIRLYIGTKESGPMLQYEPDVDGKFFGTADQTEEDEYDEIARFGGGAWTPLYSRGDYKKNPSHGGHWSGHTKNLHPSVATTWSGKQEHRGDIETSLLVMPGGEVASLPYGIGGGDIKEIDIDCSPGWVIWYESAEKAMAERLSEMDICEARLPEKSIRHLFLNEESSRLKIAELIEAFDL